MIYQSLYFAQKHLRFLRRRIKFMNFLRTSIESYLSTSVQQFVFRFCFYIKNGLSYWPTAKMCTTEIRSATFVILNIYQWAIRRRFAISVVIADKFKMNLIIASLTNCSSPAKFESWLKMVLKKQHKALCSMSSKSTHFLNLAWFKTIQDCTSQLSKNQWRHRHFFQVYISDFISKKYLLRALQKYHE